MHSTLLSSSGVPRRSLPDRYSSLLAEQAASGLSMQQFARIHGVSVCTLYQWRRRLTSASASPDREPQRLLAVDVVSSALRSGSAATYEIEFANGVSLRLPTDFDASRVSALVHALRTC